jgi:uncharacterized repeat protein (TIGR01451 family)
MMRLRRTAVLTIPFLVLLPALIGSGGTAQAAAPADVFLADVTDSPDPVSFGGTVLYSVPVGNRGPGTATAVTVTAELPPGASFQEAGSSGSCAAAGATVTCTLSTLPPDSGAALGVLVTVTTPDPLSVTFTASAADPDRDPSNNSQMETTAVTAEADLSLDFAPVFGVVYAGQRFFLGVQLFNRGPAPATGVTTTLRFPAGLTASLATCVPDGTGSVCTSAGGELPPLAGGAMLVDVLATAAGDYTVSGSVTADQPDPLPATNTDSVAFSVMPAADLAVAVAESADPSRAGQPLVYTVTVRNNGPSPASAVSLSDEWSAVVSGGIELVSVDASQGECTVSAPGRFACALGTLAPGASATATLRLQPRGVGSVTNQAQVTSAEYDGDATNNVATEATVVARE